MELWLIYGKQQTSHFQKKKKLNKSNIGLDIEKELSID